MRYWLLAAVCVVPLCAQYDPKQPLPEHVLFLAKARAAAVKEFSHFPSFVCSQTIERFERKPRARDLKLVDSIRLQVAVTATGEMFAPDGAARFDDRPIETFAPTGVISTGDFSSHVRSIFFSSASTFTWSGPEEYSGQRFRRYHFQIPKTLSGYVLRVPPNEAVIGYEGSVWFHETTLDLHRMEINGAGIPPGFVVQNIHTRIDFKRTEIGAEQRLLPRESALHMTYFDGVERRNVARFSGCRQFSGETRLLFEEPK